MRSMFDEIKKFAGKTGLSPGTLTPVEGKSSHPVKLTRIYYNPADLEESSLESPEQLSALSDPETGVSWLNLDGIHNIDWIREMGERYEIHPLAQEDIVNSAQRAKFDEFDNSLYMVLRMLSYNDSKDCVEDEQISLLLKPGLLLSFQEHPGDVFAGVRLRINEGRKRLRSGGSDYLAYALIDAIVDHYFVVLEKLGERIELLEEEVTNRPSPATLEKIHNCKRELLFLRKSVWPLREVISSVQREESPLFVPETLLFMRDVYDHTIQVIDTVETYRDIVSGLVDLYLSSVSHRMNEVMKVLTIIATIFIPLTFIAGIYGMNFARMPELQWDLGYPVVLGVMLIVALIMILFFKRRHWF